MSRINFELIFSAHNALAVGEGVGGWVFAALEERGGRLGGLSGKKKAQKMNRIRDIDRSVIINIGGVHTNGFFAWIRKEEFQNASGIGDVDPAVIIGVAAGEDGRENVEGY